MNIKGLVTSFIVFFFLASIVGCHKVSIESANREYNMYRFASAAELYKKVAKKEKNKRKKREAIFKAAECYRRFNAYSKAQQFYTKAIQMKYPDPIAIFYKAEMMRRQENFDGAITEYKNYMKEVPSDQRAKEAIESCEKALKMKNEKTRYVVENFKILNSNANDFAPVFYKNNAIIFTSDREDAVGKSKYEWTGEEHTDLYISEPDRTNRRSVKLQKPVLLDKDEIVNTPFNDGAACFDRKMNTMYYTQCNGKKGKEPNCKIYKVSKKGTAWDEPEVLSFCSDTSVNYGQPSISPDGKKLYFSSNMRGGYGGHDIWVSTLVSKGKVWSDPVNLGPVINTPGEEMYPFIYSDNKTLYFSSDEHNPIGGLDIFSTTYNDSTGEWSKPVNLGMPVNSGADDFGIIVEPNGTKTKGYKGYFSSDRPLSRKDDIYQFYMTPLKFNLAGTVFDDKTKQVVPGATVKLTINDTSSITTTSDKAGYYKFKLDPDMRYKVQASKNLYFESHTDSVSTVALDNSQDFVRDLYIYPFLDTLFPLEGIYYELDSCRLTPAAKIVVDTLYHIMIKHPYLVIEIGSHTDCRASEEYNLKLSECRAHSVVDYLIYKGIPADRLVWHGYGETMPVNKCRCENNEGPGMNCTEAEHQANRRTTFKVLRVDYVYHGSEQPPQPNENNPENTNINNQNNPQNKNINKPKMPVQQKKPQK